MFNGFKGVLYRELSVFRTRAKKQILASSLSPLLYLIAFGWSFGRGVSVDGLPYITFLIPGLITMSSLNQSYGIAQELNITRFYFHVFDEFLIAPISHTEIVLGEAAYGMFKGLLSTILIFVYALLFGVKLIFNPVFFMAILLHTFLFAALGITIAMIVRDHGTQATVNTFVITPMIFLSGTFFPVDKLPYIFKMIVYALPLTYSTKVIRASLTGGEINPLFVFLIVMFAALFFYTALWAVRRVEA
ncbi:MAG: ABC transporter permease [Nitrospirae bacterium]|nr:ABC transporter permease [Nitrospirota bacterium]